MPREVFLYPFSLKKSTNENIYGLVFCTHDLLGLDKFIAKAWKRNNLNGEANFNIERDYINSNKDQLNLNFQLQPKKLDLFYQTIDDGFSRHLKLTNEYLS